MRQHHNTATRQPGHMFSDAINFRCGPYIMRFMDIKADSSSSFSFETYEPRPDDEPSYTFLHAMLFVLHSKLCTYCTEKSLAISYVLQKKESRTLNRKRFMVNYGPSCQRLNVIAQCFAVMLIIPTRKGPLGCYCYRN